MEGGMVIKGDTKYYGGKITMFMLMTYLVAATDDTGRTNQYCKFDSQVLTSFTSYLYIAALVASFVASVITRIFGRKVSMLVGGIIFLIGSALNGIGYTNQSFPVYLSEMAPAKLRGALNMGFKLAITIGILVANLVNYGAAKIKGGYGWRVTKTRIKLCCRKSEETKKLKKNFKTLSRQAKQQRRLNIHGGTYCNRYRPQLIMSVIIPFFQQFTGVNVIMFHAPVLFKTIGFGDDSALMSVVITGLVNMFATFVSIGTVDRVGRRMLFLEGGIQMLICQILVRVILGMEFGVE
ncbi:hypothetical protein MKX03_004597, partial [Papaver bracteatum]